MHCLNTTLVQVAAAGRAYKLVLEIEPENALVLERMMETHQVLGRTAQAMAQLRKLLLVLGVGRKNHSQSLVRTTFI